ncbi:MAG: alpha/beta hydrolase [Acidimicrobiia bacterium]
MSQVLPGAEPWSYTAPNGRHGVLVSHGFTGSPMNMRGLAHAFADAGFSVELPLLPGHGTSVDDMLTTTWSDWSGAVEATFQTLAARCDKVLVAGLSMGATLALWLAINHPEIVGVVAVNPLVQPLPDEVLDMVQGMIDEGEVTLPGIGSDIADPDAKELAYELTPLPPLLSLQRSVGAEVLPKLAHIRQPMLLMNSVDDHVVEPVNGDIVAERVNGPVERLMLERSFHVATLDYDKELLVAKAVEFATRIAV